ncbi:MAG: TraK family protein, partial [Polynucleobacter sp.]|nr:TraK family protein [Polynucleobacter sp.]
MAKTYPEQLGEWVKRRESTQRDKNLVAFLAVRDDVKAAVEAGYSVKTVWA